MFSLGDAVVAGTGGPGVAPSRSTSALGNETHRSGGTPPGHATCAQVSTRLVSTTMPVPIGLARGLDRRESATAHSSDGGLCTACRPQPPGAGTGRRGSAARSASPRIALGGGPGDHPVGRAGDLDAELDLDRRPAPARGPARSSSRAASIAGAAASRTLPTTSPTPAGLEAVERIDLELGDRLCRPRRTSRSPDDKSHSFPRHFCTCNDSRPALAATAFAPMPCCPSAVVNGNGH